LEKFRKEIGQTETDRQLLLLVPPIRLHAPMRLICFFDGTKSEMIVINSLLYQLIQTSIMTSEKYKTPSLALQ